MVYSLLPIRLQSGSGIAADRAHQLHRGCGWLGWVSGFCNAVQLRVQIVSVAVDIAHNLEAYMAGLLAVAGLRLHGSVERVRAEHRRAAAAVFWATISKLAPIHPQLILHVVRLARPLAVRTQRWA